MKGRVVIVTGSTQGIGLAIARAAARAGAEAVVVTGRDAAKGAAAAAEVERRGAASAFVAADLEDPDAPDLIFDTALERFGQVDALVNSAALTDRGVARRRGPAAVGAALRGQRARAVFSHAAARQSPARARRAGLDRQHSLGARAWRLAVARGLRLDQGGARRADQERRARPSFRSHPRQRDQRRLGRHAGRAPDAGGDARQGRGMARRAAAAASRPAAS